MGSGRGARPRGREGAGRLRKCVSAAAWTGSGASGGGGSGGPGTDDGARSVFHIRRVKVLGR